MRTLDKIGRAMSSRGIVLLGLGALTGVFAGLVVTIYNIAAKHGEHFAKNIYGMIRENPAWIPLLFVALVAAAFLVAVVIKIVPMVKGSGIPQTEGATRGIMRFNWWRVLVAMSAASLFSILMGLSAGSEGPSLQLGGACGNGVGTVLRRKDWDKRYQITGGASAGLAVAFNAPLTGLLFALEEAHKRFTPEIFISAFSSVAAAVLTRNLLMNAIPGCSVGSTFGAFSFPAQLTAATFGIVVLTSIVAGLAGVGFYELCLLMRRVFGKLKFWNGMGKMMIPFVLAGCFGLLTVNVMGGGHALVESLGTHGGAQEMSIESIFGSPIMVTILVVIVLKVIVTVVNMGAGVPCGIFIPMLSIGACIGALVARVCGAAGAESDLIVMIGMAAFFTAVVKAPLTSIVMVIELTWNFTALLPVIIGVAIGYLANMIFRKQSLYEELLDLMVDEQGLNEGVKRETLKVMVKDGCEAAGRVVRDLLWPIGTVVVSIIRNGERIVPDSETKMFVGDELVLVGSTRDRAELERLIYELTGEPDPVSTETAGAEASQ